MPEEKESFISQEERPVVRLHPDTPISELRVRDLQTLLRGTTYHKWLCCKKRGAKKWKRERPSHMFLGCDSKQSGDQCDLPSHIFFVDTLHVSFPDHVHHLKSPQRSPRCLEGEEAHPRPC